MPVVADILYGDASLTLNLLVKSAFGFSWLSTFPGEHRALEAAPPSKLVWEPCRHIAGVGVKCVCGGCHMPACLGSVQGTK